MNLHDRPIIVLGMQRSGTSALSGALYRLGVDFGEQKLLYAGDVNNPQGYFEHRRATVLCLKCLDAFHMHPTSISRLPDDWKEHPLASKLVTEVKNYLTESYSARKGGAPWAIKHPLISMVLPLFLEAFDQLHLDPIFVICVRNPLENMRSEAGLNFEGSYRVMPSLGLRAIGSWLRYTLGSFADLAQRTVLVAPYEQLLADPVPLIADLVSRYPGWEFGPKELQRAVVSIDPGLRRQKEVADGLDQFPSLVQRALEAVTGFEDSPDHWRSVLALHREFLSVADLFPEPPSPPGKFGLAWAEDGTQRFAETTYEPTDGWQTVRLEIDAPRKTAVAGLLYGRPARIWIRNAVWCADDRRVDAVIKCGPSSDLTKAGTVYRLDAAFEPRQVEFVTPGFEGPYFLELDLRLEQGFEISNEIAARLAKKLDQCARSSSAI